MRTVFLALLLALATSLLLAVTARADDRVLQWDNGAADLFIHMEQDSHMIWFKSPAEWERTFPAEVMFYAKRYGDVGSITGTVVIWGPQTEDTAQIEELPESMVVYSRKNFKLADVGAEPAWFIVPLDTLELPDEFAIAIYTYSTKERGVEIGLTAETQAISHSASAKPEPVSLEELKKAQSKGKPVAGNIRVRNDGREWMIRLKVRPTLTLEEAFDAQQLSGTGFSWYDDGTAEEFISLQKNGPMIHISNPDKRQVERIYVYGKAVGDWFNTDRSAMVYILDTRYNIVSRGLLPYNRYTEAPSWGYTSFTRTTAPKEFYVLVTPNCRPKVGLLLGYDTSGANQASFYGLPGARLPWDVEAPYETTNWMIRVQYK